MAVSEVRHSLQEDVKQNENVGERAKRIHNRGNMHILIVLGQRLPTAGTCIIQNAAIFRRNMDHSDGYMEEWFVRAVDGNVCAVSGTDSAVFFSFFLA